MFQPWPQWGPPADQAYPMDGQTPAPMGWAGFDAAARPPWGWNGPGWGAPNGPYQAMPPRGPPMGPGGFGPPPSPMDHHPIGNSTKVEEPKTAEEAEKFYRNQAMQWPQQFPAWGPQAAPMGQWMNAPWPGQAGWPPAATTPGAPWATGTGGWPTPAWGYDQQAWPNQQAYPAADWATQVPAAPAAAVEQQQQPPPQQQPPAATANPQQQQPNTTEILALDDADFNYKVANWEKQFEEWKEKNKNHPDKEAFQKYEKQWQMHREHLFKQREAFRAQRAAAMLTTQNPATAIPPQQSHPTTPDSTTNTAPQPPPTPTIHATPTLPAPSPPTSQPTSLPNETHSPLHKAPAPVMNAPATSNVLPPKVEPASYPEPPTVAPTPPLPPSVAPPNALLPTPLPPKPSEPARTPGLPLLATPPTSAPPPSQNLTPNPPLPFTPPDTSKPPPGLLEAKPPPPQEKKDSAPPFSTPFNPSQPPPHMPLGYFNKEEGVKKEDFLDKRSFDGLSKPLHEYPPPSLDSKEEYNHPKGRHYFEDPPGMAADFPRSRGRGVAYRGRSNYRNKNWQSFEEEDGEDYRRPLPPDSGYNRQDEPPYRSSYGEPGPQDDPYQRAGTSYSDNSRIYPEHSSSNMAAAPQQEESHRQPYPPPPDRGPYPPADQGPADTYSDRPPYGQGQPYRDEGPTYAEPYQESCMPHDEPHSRTRWPPAEDYYQKPDYEEKYGGGHYRQQASFHPKVFDYGHRPASHLHGDAFDYKHGQVDTNRNVFSYNYSKSFHYPSFSSFTQAAVVVKDHNHTSTTQDSSIPGLSFPSEGLFPAAKSMESREYGDRIFPDIHVRRSPSPHRREDLDETKGGEYKEERTTELFPSASGIKMEPVLIKDLLVSPGRHKRPKQIVFVLRGPPGSGKTYLARLIKDKEVENGGSAPRILSLDDYFMVESDSAKGTQNKDFEYEYEAEMEESYRTSLFKCFKKTVEDRLFPIIILDAINDKVKHFEPFCSYAKSRGFQTYIIETDISDPLTCFKRNVHKRSLEDIKKIIMNWEETPSYLKKSDIRSLLQDDSIQEVEMEDTNNEEEQQKPAEDEEDDPDEEPLPHHLELSRWEKIENSDAKLDQLDGLHTGKRKHSSLEDYLQLPDNYEQRALEPGKKRVRWADIEEKKKQEKIIKMGFVVGQTDWQQFTDPHNADKALTRTKYF